MKLELKKLGSFEPQLPKSLAICLDFISIWGSDPNRAQLGRLCAGAIAICLDHEKCLPAYNINNGDPIKFGYKVMDRLLNAGVKPSYIYEQGSELLILMMNKIPTEKEVDDKANFT